MIETGSPVKGAVVYWTARRTDLDKLRQGWQPLGFAKLLPLKRKGIDLLREALLTEFRSNGRPRLVRRTANSSNLAVVIEDKQQTDNNYATIQRARLEKDGSITTDPPNPAIPVRYDALSTVLPGGTVGNMLIKAVRKLDGTTLRSTGGIYWVPPDGIDKFRLLAEALEEAGGTTVYIMSTQFDDKTAEAVKDGLKQEVEAAAKWIIEQLDSGDLGLKAIQGRRAKANKLMEKVRRYEEILGTVLQDVRASLDEVETAAATAELAAAGAEEAEGAAA